MADPGTSGLCGTPLQTPENGEYNEELALLNLSQTLTKQQARCGSRLHLYAPPHQQCGAVGQIAARQSVQVLDLCGCGWPHCSQAALVACAQLGVHALDDCSKSLDHLEGSSRTAGEASSSGSARSATQAYADNRNVAEVTHVPGKPRVLQGDVNGVAACA